MNRVLTLIDAAVTSTIEITGRPLPLERTW